MTAQHFNNILLILWIVVTSLALLAAAAILIWAVRSKQFSDQDRARYLPLDGGQKGANDQAAKPKNGNSGNVPA